MRILIVAGHSPFRSIIIGLRTKTKCTVDFYESRLVCWKFQTALICVDDKYHIFLAMNLFV